MQKLFWERLGLTGNLTTNKLGIMKKIPLASYTLDGLVLGAGI